MINIKSADPVGSEGLMLICVAAGLVLTSSFSSTNLHPRCVGQEFDQVVKHEHDKYPSKWGYYILQDNSGGTWISNPI